MKKELLWYCFSEGVGRVRDMSHGCNGRGRCCGFEIDVNELFIAGSN